MTLPLYVQGAWFVGALLFIFGLKGMSSPANARRGIVIAGYGMLIAIAATFLIPGLKNLVLMALALPATSSSPMMEASSEADAMAMELSVRTARRVAAAW